MELAGRYETRNLHVPDIKFAKSGDVNIAYDTWGSGPPLVLIPGLAANIEVSWEQEVYRRAREHIGGYVTVIEFDKRGQGASDKFDRAPTLAERIQDIHAVMDAEGVQRANLLGLSEGGIMAQYFAARHPERVEKVVLANSLAGASAFPELSAHVRPGETFPTADESFAAILNVIENWGRDPQPMVDLMVPSMAGDAAYVRWTARFQRLTATQSEMRRLLENAAQLDANAELADIKAPTLVIHLAGDRLIPAVVGRYLADKIPDARYAEFAGEDHFLWITPNWRDHMDYWIEFVTGIKPGATTERKFATVLFSDIVNSTARMTEVGDAAWSRMLDDHDRIAWNVAREHRGSLVKNTGDGLLLTFDTPSDGMAAAAVLMQQLGSVGLRIRAGLHAGEIEVRADGDVSGVAVNLAARVQQAAEKGSTYVSSTLRDMLLGGTWSFEDRGEHTLKGIDGAWKLYALSADPQGRSS